jgi:hypothetical protein
MKIFMRWNWSSLLFGIRYYFCSRTAMFCVGFFSIYVSFPIPESD